MQEKTQKCVLKKRAQAIQVRKMASKAIMPTRGSRFSAGYDLYELKDGLILAYRQKLIGTGIAIAIPQGTYDRIAP